MLKTSQIRPLQHKSRQMDRATVRDQITRRANNDLRPLLELRDLFRYSCSSVHANDVEVEIFTKFAAIFGNLKRGMMKRWMVYRGSSLTVCYRHRKLPYDVKSRAGRGFSLQSNLHRQFAGWSHNDGDRSISFCQWRLVQNVSAKVNPKNS